MVNGDEMAGSEFSIYTLLFDILNAAINDKKWDLVFYIYQNESSGLYNFITRIEDEFNAKKDLKNKKFFIVQ